ncbi:MAG: hypothetical protein JRJ73_07310, partial [Deltaproteobacteria bacterium]|nr:hypothetical protein [Deltaproteobacteria bacterium]
MKRRLPPGGFFPKFFETDGELHRVADGRAEAAAAALKAGLDVELPNPVEYPEGLKDALKKGLIIESDIDISVSRVLKMKFRLGLFENP